MIELPSVHKTKLITETVTTENTLRFRIALLEFCGKFCSLCSELLIHMCGVYLLPRGKINLLLNMFSIFLIFFNGNEDGNLKCLFFSL